jgi:hypothetical protein
MTCCVETRIIPPILPDEDVLLLFERICFVDKNTENGIGTSLVRLDPKTPWSSFFLARRKNDCPALEELGHATAILKNSKGHFNATPADLLCQIPEKYTAETSAIEVPLHENIVRAVGDWFWVDIKLYREVR